MARRPMCVEIGKPPQSRTRREPPEMLRYQCPRCHEITHRDEPTAFCGICCGR